MDYGDAGIRKTLYYVKTSIRSEGTNDNLKIQCRMILKVMQLLNQMK